MKLIQRIIFSILGFSLSFLGLITFYSFISTFSAGCRENPQHWLDIPCDKILGSYITDAIATLTVLPIGIFMVSYGFFSKTKNKK